MVKEIIHALGHPSITARHRTTFEITKDVHIMGAGDCIVAVSADKGANDLSIRFKQAASQPDTRIVVDFFAGELHERIIGHGHPDLTFEHSEDLVGRVSSYTCPRTLMVNADKSALRFDRNFVRAIQLKDVEIRIELIAIRPGRH
ncbi:MAG: DUF371 domain-containing protein [Methanosarcinales archaeon Met12]|nr:MAG: DUF371 domain-containing protein [Methanosarcinales archaeon Met12]